MTFLLDAQIGSWSCKIVSYFHQDSDRPHVPIQVAASPENVQVTQTKYSPGAKITSKF